jgi:hypothetical protein
LNPVNSGPKWCPFGDMTRLPEDGPDESYN